MFWTANLILRRQLIMCTRLQMSKKEKVCWCWELFSAETLNAEPKADRVWLVPPSYPSPMCVHAGGSFPLLCWRSLFTLQPTPWFCILK
jgi:hypothetical protein